LSSTLMRGNRRRLSGTCAMPTATMRCAGVAPQVHPLHGDGARCVDGSARDQPAGAWSCPRRWARSPRPLPVAPSSETSKQGLEAAVPARPDLELEHVYLCAPANRAGRARLGAEVQLDHPWLVGRDRPRRPLRDLLAVIADHHPVPTRIRTPMMCSTQMMVMPRVLADPVQQSARPDPSPARRARSGSRPRAGAWARWPWAFASSSFFARPRRARPPWRPGRRAGRPAPARRSADSKARRRDGPALAEEAGEGQRSRAGRAGGTAGESGGPADAEVDDPVRSLPPRARALRTNRARVGDERTREQVEDRALAGSVGPDEARGSRPARP